MLSEIQTFSFLKKKKNFKYLHLLALVLSTSIPLKDVKKSSVTTNKQLLLGKIFPSLFSNSLTEWH